MNYLIVSDTHGNTRILEQLLENYKSITNTVIHLGDHARDMSRFKDNETVLYIVNGNTDPMIAEYDERVIELDGKRIFITHGHRYGVKSSYTDLIYKAEELDVQACLFGHSHVPVIFKEKGIFFMNPGSPTHPRPGDLPGYALMRIEDDGQINGMLMTYKESSI